jgi:hypothetical protein
MKEVKMFFLTEDATIVCDHRLGVVTNVPTQNLVMINQRRILVEPDPEGKFIKGCPNYGPTVKPCTATLVVKEGYSGFIRIDGWPVCLEPVTGLTDGTPPGVVNYIVIEPGQGLVSGA